MGRFEGSFQPTPGGGSATGAWEVTSDGSRVVWATWLSGNGLEVPNTGIRIDAHFSQLSYASYLGGESYDDGRSCFLDKSGFFYVAGSTNGPGWPSVRPAQVKFAGGGGGKELCYQGGCYAGDLIVTIIEP